MSQMKNKLMHIPKVNFFLLQIWLNFTLYIEARQTNQTLMLGFLQDPSQESPADAGTIKIVLCDEQPKPIVFLRHIHHYR